MLVDRRGPDCTKAQRLEETARRTTNNGWALYIDAEIINTVERYIRLKRKKSANGGGKKGSFVDNPNIIHPNKGTLALSNSVTPTSAVVLSLVRYGTSGDVGNGTGRGWRVPDAVWIDNRMYFVLRRGGLRR